MSGLLAVGCGDVSPTGDDDDDDSADASVTIDGAGGGGPDAAGGGGPDAAGGGDPDARPGDPDAKVPVFCGGFGGVECSKTEWCDFDFGCGFDDGGGVCEPRPEACPDVFAPVCGCDFRTYGNACEAHAEGQDVLHDGECEGTPTPGG